MVMEIVITGILIILAIWILVNNLKGKSKGCSCCNNKCDRCDNCYSKNNK